MAILLDATGCMGDDKEEVAREYRGHHGQRPRARRPIGRGDLPGQFQLRRRRVEVLSLFQL
ncbi:MAG: hypothetical protein M5R36_12155, partial [Deltaproteobacteria bacterium]|nr:hypothetical protein [Deltaproteobacteria bacterium]